MSLRQLAPWLLFIAIALVYLLFPTRVYYWDGIAFAQAIEDAPSLTPSLVHPNHLIYNFAGYFFYNFLRSLGADIRAITALQILNSASASGADWLKTHARSVKEVDDDAYKIRFVKLTTNPSANPR